MFEMEPPEPLRVQIAPIPPILGLRKEVIIMSILAI